MTSVTAHPGIPAERYAERLERLSQLVVDRGLAAALIGVGSDLDYLTGYRAMPLERLTMLAVVAGEEPVLVVPRLEEAAARAGSRPPVRIATWMETDDPHALVMSLVEGARGRAAATIAVSDRLWSAHLLRFQASAPGTRWVSATEVLRELRIVKDPPRSSCFASPEPPPIASWTRSPPGGWWGGPRRTSRARSGSG